MRRLTLLPILILLFTTTSIVYAQNQDLDEHDMDQWARGANVVPTKSSADVEGTPFYNEEWQSGHIFLRSGNKSERLPLKYNAYTNELLFRKAGKMLAVIPRQVTGFVLLTNNQQTVFKNDFKSEEYDISSGQFFRVVYDGSIKLLVKHNTRQHERRDVLSGGNTVIKYIPKKQYFLVQTDGTFHKVKLKRKDILRALGEYQKQLKNFAENRDLDFGDESDLPNILTHYEELTSTN